MGITIMKFNKICTFFDETLHNFLFELSAGLDIENATFIREMIHKNIETVIEITHDENIDDKFYDKTFRITNGEIVEVK